MIPSYLTVKPIKPCTISRDTQNNIIKNVHLLHKNSGLEKTEIILENKQIHP